MRYPDGDISALVHVWETFFDETYQLLDVKGKTVVDVGASFGDTALYFAMKGATRVYAYEPMREVFPYLQANIRANRFEDKVFAVRKAVSSKKGRVYLKPQARWYGSSFVSEKPNGTGYWVSSEPLSLNADMLKMDCEGCEYDVPSNVDPILLGYEEMMLEFHHGSQLLVRVLSKAGYEVKIIAEHDNKTWGMLYCKARLPLQFGCRFQFKEDPVR